MTWVNVFRVKTGRNRNSSCLHPHTDPTHTSPSHIKHKIRNILSPQAASSSPLPLNRRGHSLTQAAAEGSYLPEPSYTLTASWSTSTSLTSVNWFNRETGPTLQINCLMLWRYVYIILLLSDTVFIPFNPYVLMWSKSVFFCSAV